MARFIIFALLLALATPNAIGVVIQRTEELFGQDYVVSWTADTELETIQFTIVAKTTGYVGFGISQSGKMVPADIIIGGVDDNGTAYFQDRHASVYGIPEVDDQQDWFLVSANQTDSHTTLVINRNFVTCDENDTLITSDGTNFIWSMGASDTIAYHLDKRGFSSVYILDPPNLTPDISGFEPWGILVNTTIPTRDTSYWCTVHKTPEAFAEIRHIVGFEVLLNSTEALTYTHHLIVHHCPFGPGTPEGARLEAAMNTPGGECYKPQDETDKMYEIVELCPTYFYVWAKGGKPLFTPEDVGIPLNEKNQSEYFILEIHYDNPKVDADVSYIAGVQVYTTTELRPIEGGHLSIMREISYDFLIPPGLQNYMVNAHCSPECLKQGVMPQGITAYNVLLHSHLAGRRIKLRHFRDGQELPWVLNDDHYDFDFQQNRPLRTNVQILPNDSLVVECSYDSMEVNTPVWSGFSTRDEMCDAFIMYYPRMPTLDKCGSTFYDETALFGAFGIQEFYNYSDIIKLPEEFEGLTYKQVLDEKINWTQPLIDYIQNATFNWPHYMVCPILTTSDEPQSHSKMQPGTHSSKPMEDLPPGMVTYPENYTQYIPPNPEEQCERQQTTPVWPSSPTGPTGSSSVTDPTNPAGSSSVTDPTNPVGSSSVTDPTNPAGSSSVTDPTSPSGSSPVVESTTQGAATAQASALFAVAMALILHILSHP